jgi:multidrug efflux system membrane fusion protein
MSSSPSRRWIWYGLVALVFAVGTWYFAFHAKPAPRTNPWGGMRNNTQAVPVRAVAAERRDLPVYLKAIGTAVPLNTVTVRSRVDGQLLKIAFEEGQRVEKGQLLAEIDPAPYRIRLAQMEAQQRQNVALLETAKKDLERFRQLHGQTLITNQQLEQQQALVAEREGAVAADQAMVEEARLQLAYTRVEAPITGRLGLRQVDVGNMIRAGDANGLVVITQTRPISVMFTVPEIDLAKVITPLRAGEALVAEAWDRGEQTQLASGILKTVDNQIDLATGTLRLKAEFPNTEDQLFPNQFVNVRLRVRTLQDVIVIPAAAVQHGSRGTYVYAVNEKNQAVVRDVVLGPAEGQWQSIEKGVAAGDTIVLEGLDRLREGRAVTLVSDEPAGKAPDQKAPATKGPGRQGNGGAKKGT